MYCGDNGRSCLNLVPNVCGELGGWMRHPVTREDTMTRLALKYDTSIGLICRANRMHWQDVLQTRHFIWVPAPRKVNAIEETLLQYRLPPPPCRISLEKPPKELAKIPPKTASAHPLLAFPFPDALLTRHQSVSANAKLLPPHFYRQSSPNPNVLAEEGDPLLITTKIIWRDLLQRTRPK